MAPDSEGEFEGDYGEFEGLNLGPFEDGNATHMEREGSLEDRIKATGKAIRTKKRFTIENDIDDFFRDYSDIADKSSPKGVGNLLHILVEAVTHGEGIEPEQVKLLVRRLVEKYPELLKNPNKDGYNPVFLAIRESQHQLVDYMISTCIDDNEQSIHRECLNEALSMQAQEGRTCLHLALKDNLDPDTIKMMIKNASDKALMVQDDFGKTPMHYAVSFAQSTNARAELIALFIERDLKAIQRRPRPPKTFLDLADKYGSSIYWEHRKTRASVTKWMADQRLAAEGAKRDQSGISRPTERPAPRDPRSQAGTRNPRHAVSAKPAVDHDGERFGRDGGADSGLDQRELLRQKKKAEERLGVSEPSAKTDRSKERDPADRDVSQNRPTRIGEIDENAALSPIQANNATLPQDPVPNTSIRRSNTGRQEKDKQPAGPAQPPEKSASTADSMTVWTKNSDKILLSLKLHYMRTRNTEMAIFFLYRTNMNDVQISFDYDRLPSPLQWTKFINRFGANSKSGLKFDRVLQYVTFPLVEVQQPRGRLADRAREAELRELGDLGRKDMKYFFDWLYEKGVRHIIKLSVEDSGDFVGEVHSDSVGKIHSDQVIQASIERFIVEELDWRKTDLDPETILHVSSKVIEKKAPTRENPKNTELVPDRQLRHLYLRWSGSNAVLRAWSEPEGLPMLPQLQRLYLFKPPSGKRYDNPQWINEKVEQFKIRLNASRRAVRPRELTDSAKQAVPDVGVALGDVEVITPDSSTYEERQVPSHDGPHSTTSAPAKGVNSHQWLVSTERFATQMTPFWEKTVAEFLESRNNLTTTDRVEEDVVLALIDDGVDMFDPALTQQILEGKSFDFHDGKVRPYFSSARGHGTVMANMILRVCPMAKVYPIRLKTYDNADGKSTIDADYAAQAIQAALDKKATIISMSWTLPMEEGTSDSKDGLYAVLKKAVERKVLMFCSAPDQGKFTALDYPSGPFRDHFFRIGAARADGTIFGWTPDDGITYVLPGVDVIIDLVNSSGSSGTPSAKGVTTRVAKVRYETGSSIATALAAGLAAMIIYCVKASIMAWNTANKDKGRIVGMPISDNGAKLISENPDAMKRAFARLGTVTPHNFIPVWEELDKVSDTLEILLASSSTPELKVKCVERFLQFGLKLTNPAK